MPSVTWSRVCQDLWTLKLTPYPSRQARKVGRRRKQEEEDGDDSTYEAEPGSASGDDRASSGGEEDTEGVDATTTAVRLGTGGPACCRRIAWIWQGKGHWDSSS